ncbi:hypothetical protein QBC38DRAFT_461477 [Podospora fimiseda]|uniref:Uncharacterized protein n=1 Tax=Podospora fimiseda TaxID=252190 RepID=A0AAN6YMF3_9PEZI|nr:hypothetical protein QBC38DRAFT_461477 [Podospora fimiseda]
MPTMLAACEWLMSKRTSAANPLAPDDCKVEKEHRNDNDGTTRVETVDDDFENLFARSTRPLIGDDDISGSVPSQSTSVQKKSFKFSKTKSQRLPLPSKPRRQSAASLSVPVVRLSSKVRMKVVKAVIWKEYTAEERRTPTRGPVVTITKEDGQTFYLEDRTGDDDVQMKREKMTEMVADEALCPLIPVRCPHTPRQILVEADRTNQSGMREPNVSVGRMVEAKNDSAQTMFGRVPVKPISDSRDDDEDEIKVKDEDDVDVKDEDEDEDGVKDEVKDEDEKTSDEED